MIVLTIFKQNTKWSTLTSNLSITRRCNDLLLERITQLERNNLNNPQYNRRETLEISPVPSDIADDIHPGTIFVPSAISNRNISRTGRP